MNNIAQQLSLGKRNNIKIIYSRGTLSINARKTTVTYSYTKFYVNNSTINRVMEATRRNR